jgi:hypothetical protein
LKCRIVYLELKTTFNTPRLASVIFYSQGEPRVRSYLTYFYTL